MLAEEEVAGEDFGRLFLLTRDIGCFDGFGFGSGFGVTGSFSFREGRERREEGAREGGVGSAG
jgi:hypothetical protein